MVYPPLFGALQGCKVVSHYFENFRAMCCVAPPLFWLFGWLKNVDHTLHPTLFQKLCQGNRRSTKTPFLWKILGTPFQATTKCAFDGIMNQKRCKHHFLNEERKERFQMAPLSRKIIDQFLMKNVTCFNKIQIPTSKSVTFVLNIARSV